MSLFEIFLSPSKWLILSNPQIKRLLKFCGDAWNRVFGTEDPTEYQQTVERAFEVQVQTVRIMSSTIMSVVFGVAIQ